MSAATGWTAFFHPTGEHPPVLWFDTKHRLTIEMMPFAGDARAEWDALARAVRDAALLDQIRRQEDRVVDAMAQAMVTANYAGRDRWEHVDQDAWRSSARAACAAIAALAGLLGTEEG